MAYDAHIPIGVLSGSCERKASPPQGTHSHETTENTQSDFFPLSKKSVTKMSQAYRDESQNT